MTRFLITYTDPETGEPAEHIGNYDTTPGIVTDNSGKVLSEGPPISAREWAEDHAYMLADKGAYTIKELP